MLVSQLILFKVLLGFYLIITNQLKHFIGAQKCKHKIFLLQCEFGSERNKLNQMQNFVLESYKMEFPYKITNVKGVINNKIAKEFPGLPLLAQVGPEKWILPTSYADFAGKIYNFEARPDDVFICTFPRSGTTWTQEMIWLISNNLDYEEALKVTQFERFPFLE